MKKRGILISGIIALVVIALVAVGIWAYKTGKFAGLADIINQSSSGGVILRTVDQSGQPVPNARVEICQKDIGATDYVCDPTHFTTSPDTGIFTSCWGLPECNVSNYPPGVDEILSVKYSVSKENLCSKPEKIEISGDNFRNKLNNISFILDTSCIGNPAPGKAIIKGVVTDEQTNAAIEGAIVAISNAGNMLLGRTTTDANGNYVLKDIPAGIDYNFLASKDGYETYKIRRNIAENQVYTDDIILKKSVEIPTKFNLLVSFKDWGGNFIDRGRIDISRNDTTTVWTRYTEGKAIDTAKYGQDVNAVFPNLDTYKWNDPNSLNYTYTVRITHPYFTTIYGQEFSFKAPHNLSYNQANNTLFYKIFYSPGKNPMIKIYGKVTHAITHDPLPDIRVELTNRNFSSVVYSTDTNSKGEYEFKDIPGGWEYTLEAKDITRPIGYTPFAELLSLKFTATPLEDIEKNIELSPTTKNYIYGQVIDKQTNKPIQGVKISIVRGNQLTDQNAETNEQGFYIIRGVHPGKIILRAFKLGYSDDDSSRQKITVVKDKETRADFKMWSFSVNEPKTFNLCLVFISEETRKPVHPMMGIDVVVSSNEKADDPSPKDSSYFYFKENLEGVESCADDKGILYQVPHGKIFIYVAAGDNGGFAEEEKLYAEASFWIPESAGDTVTKTILAKEKTSEEPGTGAFINAQVYLEDLGCIANYGEARSSLFSPNGLNATLENKSGSQKYESTVDPEGIVSFSDLAIGNYSLKVGNSLYSATKDNISIRDRTDDLQVYLKLEPKDNKAFSSKKYHGIEVKFSGYGAQDYVNIIDWENAIRNFQTVQNRFTSKVKPFNKIYVVDTASINYAYYINNWCGNGDYGLYVSTAYLLSTLPTEGRSGYNIDQILAHEFGHHIDYNYLRKSGEYKFLGRAYNAAQSSGTCPFDLISDPTTSLLPWASGSHVAENSSEYFASFFYAYYYHHDYLHGVIKYHAQGECQNVLAYTWEFFAQEIGPVYRNDFEMFPPQGDKLKLEPIKIIKNGKWRKEYDPRIGDYIDTVFSNILSNPTIRAVPLSAQKIISSLSRLFFWQKRGNIEVTVSELVDGQGMPIEGAVVNIGGFCTTNKEGVCTINNISAGGHKVKIYDGTTLDTLEISSIDKIKIEEDKTMIKEFIVR